MLDRLHAISLSHRRAPAELLAQFALPGDAPNLVYRDLGAHGVGQALVLSTCNRVEIYAVCDGESVLVEALKARRFGLSSSFYRFLDRLRGEAAAEHLFQVAAGMESAILGEHEIQGQVRRAFELANSLGFGGGVLGRTVQAALRAGKRARAVALLNRYEISLARLVASKISGPWTLVGTGQLAEELVAATGVPPQKVLSRSLQRATELSARLGAFAGLLSDLTQGGQVVWATDAELPTGYVPGPGFIDLATPTVSHREAGVVSLQDLQSEFLSASATGERQIETVRETIETEWSAFREEVSTWPLRETVARLHRQVREVANAQLEWATGEMEDLTPRQRMVLEAMVARIVSRTLHKPITNLQRLGGDPQYAEAIESLFDLGEVREALSEEG